MITTCPSCGTAIQPGSAFCDNCGINLSNAQPRPPTPASAPAPSPMGLSACPQCGNLNVPGAVFCENCGASLGVSAGQPHPGVSTVLDTKRSGEQPSMPQPPVPSPAAASLTGRLVIAASGVSLAIPSDKMEAIIGREDPVSGVFPEIDLEPHDGLNNGVGRRHARLTCQAGQVYIEDLNSVNHTHLRGQKLVPGQKYALNNGDELVLGKMKLTYFTS